MTRLLIAAAALSAVVPPSVAAAAGRPFVLTDDRYVGTFHVAPAAHPTLRAARRAFGQPSGLSGDRSTCTGRWGRIELVGLFTTFGGPYATRCDGRLALQVVRVFSPRWRTDRGLRVGQSLARARRLYPRGRMTDWYGARAYGLRFRNLFGNRTVTLVAVIGRGTSVRSLQIFTGAAGD
jgi:hypothetical protein